MMKTLISGLVCLAALLPGSASAADSRPNILFLLSDDHSYPYLSCYGSPNVATPHLDQLAAEGIRCHRFFTAAPQCVPSRAALMTGRSPVAARITRFSSPLAADEITFPELLKQHAGYYTGVCGRSYHLDGSGDRAGTGLGGFLEQNGLRTFRSRLDYVNTGNDRETLVQMNEFLAARPQDKPFFLWINFSDPHHPWNATAERPDPANLQLPAHWPDLPGLRSQLADYFAEINRLDATVGDILKQLSERGLAGNTIVIFCGDNGAALPHGKGSLYDPGCNVPFVVRWPGVVKPNTESRDLLSGEDLGPTLLEAAGVTVPDRMSGHSFLGLLRGTNWTPRQYVWMERGPHGSAPVTVGMSNSGFDLARAVRSDRFKLIYNCTPWIPYSPVDSAGGAGWKEMQNARDSSLLSKELVTTYFSSPRPVYELYDLEADPSELNNISGTAEFLETERKLRRALAEKMILDFDYLPLPDLNVQNGRNQAAAPVSRETQFQQKDTDGDGRLSWEEFRVNRNAQEARQWFTRRDTNQDNFLSRPEFIAAIVPDAGKK